MKLLVVVHEMPEGDFRAKCPALPGCVARAHSVDAVMEKIRGFIEGYVASLNVPQPGKFEMLVQEFAGAPG